MATNKRCVEEEEYILRLSSIIRRDFFPDLPLLQAKYDWLVAEEKNDLAGMQNALQQIERLERQPLPLAEPQQGLDEFFAKYISQDNASYEKAIMVGQEERAKKMTLSAVTCKLNSFIFAPTPQIAAEFVEARFYSKNIAHQNTRFASVKQEQTLPNSSSVERSLPKTKYLLVAASTPAMTWGAIESTPQILPYQLPPTPRRDEIANSINRANQKAKTKQTQQQLAAATTSSHRRSLRDALQTPKNK